MSNSVSERMVGAYQMLRIPALYGAVQHLLGSNTSRQNFVDNHIRPSDGVRVLDIGCGTGELADYLPNVEFVGFDPNPSYIESANEAGRPHATFHCLGIDEAMDADFGTFDIAVAKGVLHHLTDTQADRVGELAARVLHDGGRFVSVDPCFVDGQRWVAKELVRRDRGANVRKVNEYGLLFDEYFTNVTVEHHDDFLRLPYDHAVVHASN